MQVTDVPCGVGDIGPTSDGVEDVREILSPSKKPYIPLKNEALPCIKGAAASAEFGLWGFWHSRFFGSEIVATSHRTTSRSLLHIEPES